jgi:hypothetical protein
MFMGLRLQDVAADWLRHVWRMRHGGVDVNVVVPHVPSMSQEAPEMDTVAPKVYQVEVPSTVGKLATVWEMVVPEVPSNHAPES